MLQSRADVGGTQLIGRVQILDQRTLTIRASTDIDVGLADFFPTEDPRPHIAIGADRQVHVASGACNRVSLNAIDLTLTKTTQEVCVPANRYIEAASAAATSGAWVHVGGHGEVYRGDSAKPQAFANLPVDQPEVLAISPDAGRLAVTQGDVIYVGRPTEDEAAAMATVSLEGTSGISAVEFLAEDRLVSAGIGGLALWDTAMPGPLARPAGVQTPDAIGFIDAPSLQLSVDSSRAAIADEAGIVHVIQTTGQAAAVNLPTNALSLPLTTAWSPDSRALAVVAGDGAGQIWDLSGTPNQKASWPPMPEFSKSDQADSAAWTPTGELLIVGLDGGVLRSTSPGQLPKLVLPSGARTDTNFLPKLSMDGTSLVRADGQELELVDLRTDTRRELGSASTASFANFDGTNRVVVGRRDGTTEVRDAATGALVGPATGALGYGGEVVGEYCRFSDCRWVHDRYGHNIRTTTSTDSTSTTGRRSDTVPRSKPQQRIALTADGRTIVTATSGGQVFLWSLDTETAIDRSCSTAGHDLSPEDWTRLVGGDAPADLRCRRQSR